MAFTRKFLKDLGIEDSVVEDIMDKFGAAVKGEKTAKEQARSELRQAQKELADLKEKSGSTDDLTKQLEEKDANIAKLNHEIKAIRISTAVEKAGAVNTDVVTKMLDLDKVDIDDKGALTGLDDQLKALKDETSTSFLFKAEGREGDGGEGTEGAKKATGQQYDPNKGGSPKEKTYGAKVAESAKEDSGKDSGPSLWG